MNEIFVLTWASVTNAGVQYEVCNLYKSKEQAMNRIKELLAIVVPDFGDCTIRYNKDKVIVTSDNNNEFYHEFVIEEHGVVA